jgi:hypothetical protein
VAATAAARLPTLRLLSRLGDWLCAHERAVSAVTGVVIGAIFILRGRACAVPRSDASGQIARR